MKYIYPVVLDYTEKSFINIMLPSFEFAITCVDRDGDYTLAAQELLSLAIVDYEDRGVELPTTFVFRVLENQKTIFVEVDMNYWRPLVINVKDNKSEQYKSRMRGVKNER